MVAIFTIMNLEYQEHIVNKAREEILHPTFITTKQYLAIHEVEIENALPKIERIAIEYSDNIVSVYFPIKDEQFFLVVFLEKQPEIKVQAVEIESGHRVYLTATSEQLTYNQLSQLLTFKPLQGWSKGDIKKNRKSKYIFSRVSFEPIKNTAYGLEEKLNLLLHELEKDIESIRKLTKNTNAYISICRYQYVSGNAGISFDINLINRLAKLNLSIDIDTYIVGNALQYNEID